MPVDRRGFFATGLAAAIFACSRQSKELWPGESGNIVRIIDGDTLALDTGLRVRLAGIEAPSRRRGEPYEAPSREALEILALGRRCHLYYGGLTRDHFNRALSHVFVEDELGRRQWVNARLIELGTARVRTWPHDCAKAGDMLALEDKARHSGLGLWGLTFYAPLRPEELALAGERRGLILVEGHAAEIAYGQNRDGVCQYIAGAGLRLELARHMRQSGFLPASAQRLRVRGGLDRRNKEQPRLIINHWEQIERLA